MSKLQIVLVSMLGVVLVVALVVGASMYSYHAGASEREIDQTNRNLAAEVTARLALERRVEKIEYRIHGSTGAQPK